MYPAEIFDAIDGSEIAIIGMACRFPGAPNLAQFWRNLAEGVESIRFLEDEEIETAGMDRAMIHHPNYVKAAAHLEDIDKFDAAFFGYTPKEAELMDPQQRIFLEEAWHALEHGGYNAETLSDPVGVFCGARTNTYLLGLAGNRELVNTVGPFEIGLGNDMAFLSSRVSYKLNLRGPGYSVHTACSTSLVAVHLACQSLLIGECKMALAGGIAINVPHKSGYLYTQGGIASPDGHTRAFDAKAQGTVFGSGVGVVLLKRLEDALRDGDRIQAVIRATAANNDGSQKASYTAPSVYGQTEVVLEALAAANVKAESIGFIETHGTGTNLGDPIEVRALTKAFATETTRKGFCTLGSVKTNFGHLDAAAGIAGLIKAVLVLAHKQLPPTLHFEQANPNIDFENSPFRVNPTLEDWPASAGPRRAGVSAFGVGGTNVHAILEEAPSPLARSRPSQNRQLLPLSAKTETALETQTQALAEWLTHHPEEDLADVAFTLQTGRAAMKQRCVALCDGRDAAAVLRGSDPARLAKGESSEVERSVVFLFPGGGAQHLRMAWKTYRAEPVFREWVDRCFELFEAHLGLKLSDLFYPEHEPEAGGENLERTGLALPALFSIEYALAQLWISWGLNPSAMIGHSLGEYTAACLAGVFSLADAVALVTLRAQLFEGLPRGAMLNAALSPTAARDYLTDNLSVAAVNGPRHLVFSGPIDEIEQLATRLSADGIDCRRLHIEVAAHSAMLEPILKPFGEFLATLQLGDPQTPFVSNVTGTWITSQQARDPKYWVSQLRGTVQFGKGVVTLISSEPRFFLEAGPGNTLATLVKSQLDSADEDWVFTSLPHPNDRRPDHDYLLMTAARLWIAGAKLDWQALHRGEPRGRVPLPTYPFEGRRFWIDPVEPSAARTPNLMMGKNPVLDDWFSTMQWRQVAKPQASEEHEDGSASPGRWLVLADESGFGEGLAWFLESKGLTVIIAKAGKSFAAPKSSAPEGSAPEVPEFVIDPTEPGDYRRMLEILAERDQLPDIIAHCWTVTTEAPPSSPALFDQIQSLGYYSLLYLAQALAASAPERPIRLGVIADHLHEVSGGDQAYPEKATMAGPLKVLPQEMEYITCCAIDIQLAQPGSRQELQLYRDLMGEMSTDQIEVEVAYRGGRRWACRPEPSPLPKTGIAARHFNEKGVYLITGGMGGVGYLIGQFLAREYRARLILTGRSALPPRERWPELAADEKTPAMTRRKIGQLTDLEAMGGEVWPVAIDVADEKAMAALIDEIHTRYGRLDGVLHMAGVTSGTSLYKPFTDINRDDSETQFQPKVRGLYVLEKVLAGRQPEFVALFSSNAAVLGGLGFFTYAAANAFMDAFAASRRQLSAFPWVCANWDPWPEETRHYENVQTSMDQYTMSGDECREAFRRLVNFAEEGRTIVATGDLPARYELWITRAARAGTSEISHERPESAGQYIAPRTATEQAVADIWHEVLGIDQIGAEDNFFDLGGHSLLATRLVSRIQHTLGVELSLQQFFTAPTVAATAQAIDQKEDDSEQSDQLEILKQLAALSEAEVSAELERRMSE